MVTMEERTIDDIINTVGDRPNLLMVALATWAMSLSMVGVLCAYMVQFTGFTPWEPVTCLTQHCSDALNETKYLTDIEKICEEGLVYGEDYTWLISRTSLTLEWNLICDKDKVSLLESFFFIGGSISLIIGSYIYDTIGRRRACLIGAATCLTGTFLGTICHSYTFLMIIRLLMGFGNFLAYAGAYIWVLEFMPEKFRNYYNTCYVLLWCLGYPALVGVSYFIHTWQYIHAGSGVVFMLCYIPLTFYPDSPRYLLAIGKEDEAKVVLENYGWITNVKINLDNTKLIGSPYNTGSKGISIKSKMLKYFNHPGMALELAIQGYLWFTCCLLYYGVNYGWGSFGTTPYVSYLFAGLSEAIAYVLLTVFISLFGRKLTLSTSLLVSSACFLLSLTPWQWSDTGWSLERLLSLIIAVWISIAYAQLLLYSGELTPTCLRGYAMSMCHLLAKAGNYGTGPRYTRQNKTIPRASR
eukprot:sb/3464425/